ncbi:AMP-binding protein [Streptomyces sp. M19]
MSRWSPLTARQRREVSAPAAIDPGAGELVHRLVAASAAHHGDTVAVVHGSRHVSHRELDRWSDRFARDLRARGCGPGDVVGSGCPGRRSCSWPCWACSRREPRICRSAPSSPPGASCRCWPRPAPGC